jgi:hypothetical protein
MNEKSLLSLREIARELNLKYKTVLNFKNQLEPFLPGVFDGRNFKYFPDSKDILELIAALREEGFTFSMIKEIFLGNHKVENDPLMNEWICECIDNHRHHWVQVDGSACASMDQYGSACASLDQYRPIQANPVQSKPGQTSTDQPEPIQASMDLNMPVYAGMDAKGFICTGMDVAGFGRANPDQDKPAQADTDQSKSECSDPDQDAPEHVDSDKDGLAHSGADVAAQILAGMDQAKKVWLKEVEALLGSLLTEQARMLQHTLQKMATQSNIAITALCEAAEDIRTAVLNLDTRLSRLERDLDVDVADPMELYQVEAGNYQVDLPEIAMPDMKPAAREPAGEKEAEAEPDDLALLRDSIDNGIPDRNLLVQWVLAKREEDLQAHSYRILAGMLTKGGIPTLSGRDTWSRSTVRNLVTRFAAAEQE